MKESRERSSSIRWSFQKGRGETTSCRRWIGQRFSTFVVYSKIKPKSSQNKLRAFLKIYVFSERVRNISKNRSKTIEYLGKFNMSKLQVLLMVEKLNWQSSPTYTDLMEFVTTLSTQKQNWHKKCMSCEFWIRRAWREWQQQQRRNWRVK